MLVAARPPVQRAHGGDLSNPNFPAIAAIAADGYFSAFVFAAEPLFAPSIAEGLQKR